MADKDALSMQKFGRPFDDLSNTEKDEINKIVMELKQRSMEQTKKVY